MELHHHSTAEQRWQPLTNAALQVASAAVGGRTAQGLCECPQACAGPLFQRMTVNCLRTQLMFDDDTPTHQSWKWVLWNCLCKPLQLHPCGKLPSWSWKGWQLQLRWVFSEKKWRGPVWWYPQIIKVFKPPWLNASRPTIAWIWSFVAFARLKKTSIP